MVIRYAVLVQSRFGVRRYGRGMGPMPRSLLKSARIAAATAASMAALLGCSEAGDAPLGWGGPIDAEVVSQWSADRMMEVPRWTPEESPAFVHVLDSLLQRSVDKAAVLPDGRVVLVYSVPRSDSLLLHFLEPASGEETRIVGPKGREGERLAWVHSFLATHDENIIVMVDNRPRERRWGTDVWYADLDGDFTGPSSFIEAMGGALLGVFPDGSLVVMLHRQSTDSTRVSSVALFKPLEQASTVEVLPFTMAAPTDPTGTYSPAWAHLPARASAVAGDTVWTVPTERPQLFAVHRSGTVLIRIEWEAGDRSVPPTASQFWDGAERFPAAVSLMIGADGLIYVQRRTLHNGNPGAGPEWLVFSGSGELMGLLEIPRGWRVLAFGNRAVVATLRNTSTDRYELRVYGLTESGITNTGS